MVEVKYWETNSQRKKEDALGVFKIDIVPVEVPEVDENLKGKTDRNGNDLYEIEVAKREQKVKKSILDCKFAALDKVREIVGYDGVLVANIAEESEEK